MKFNDPATAVHGTNHDIKGHIFVLSDLARVTHVLVRVDMLRTLLQPCYKGPIAILK